MPKPLGENFGVIFLAFLTIRAHLTTSGSHGEFLANFRQNATWMLFVALFAGFPFAGGLGVIVGFMCVATAMLGFFCHFAKKQGSATLGLVVDSPLTVDRFGGSCRLPEWFFRMWNVLMVVLLSLTVLNNFIHIFRNEFHRWCDDDKRSGDDCIGPFLIWPDSFLDSVNHDKFGSVFSLDLNRCLELWTPLFLVVWFLAAGSESWLLNAFFLVFIAIFGAFGYGGNMGVVVGIGLCVAAVVSFLVAVLAGREASAPNGGYRYMRDGALLA